MGGSVVGLKPTNYLKCNSYQMNVLLLKMLAYNIYCLLDMLSAGDLYEEDKSGPAVNLFITMSDLRTHKQSRVFALE